MKIVLNGKEASVQKGMSIVNLVAEKNLNPDLVLVEYNYEVIKKESWPDIKLKDGDRLEIFQLVGGG